MVLDLTASDSLSSRPGPGPCSGTRHSSLFFAIPQGTDGALTALLYSSLWFASIFGGMVMWGPLLCAAFLMGFTVPLIKVSPKNNEFRMHGLGCMV